MWTVTLGLLVSIVFFSGVGGVFFVVLTVFFQEGFGYSASTAGLMFLPFAIGFSGASAIAIASSDWSLGSSTSGRSS